MPTTRNSYAPYKDNVLSFVDETGVASVFHLLPDQFNAAYDTCHLPRNIEEGELYTRMYNFFGWLQREWNARHGRAGEPPTASDRTQLRNALLEEAHSTSVDNKSANNNTSTPSASASSTIEDNVATDWSRMDTTKLRSAADGIIAEKIRQELQDRTRAVEARELAMQAYELRLKGHEANVQVYQKEVQAQEKEMKDRYEAVAAETDALQAREEAIKGREGDIEGREEAAKFLQQKNTQRSLSLDSLAASLFDREHKVKEGELENLARSGQLDLEKQSLQDRERKLEDQSSAAQQTQMAIEDMRKSLLAREAKLAKGDAQLQKLRSELNKRQDKLLKSESAATEKQPAIEFKLPEVLAAYAMQVKRQGSKAKKVAFQAAMVDAARAVLPEMLDTLSSCLAFVEKGQIGPAANALGGAMMVLREELPKVLGDGVGIKESLSGKC